MEGRRREERGREERGREERGREGERESRERERRYIGEGGRGVRRELGHADVLSTCCGSPGHLWVGER